MRFAVREHHRSNWDLKRGKSTSVTVCLRRSEDRVTLVEGGPIQVGFAEHKVSMSFRHDVVTEEEARKLSVPADKCDKCGTKCNDTQGCVGPCKKRFEDRLETLRKQNKRS